MTSRGMWTSRMGFILAAAGSAVGLGNVWKLPYVTGTNGGGYFILIYLVAVLALGFPIMIAEFVLGRNTGTSPVGTYRKLAGKGSPFVVLGWMGVAAGFIILSYYSVVAGWTLHYVILSITNAFTGREPNEIRALFGDLYAHGPLNLFWHTIFMAITVAVVLGGVQKGIERSSKIMMPLLFLLLAILVGYGVFSDGFGRTVSFIFLPKAENLSAKTVLEAIGQAFFSLSLGMGAMLTYGSYLDKKVDLVRSSLLVCLMDTGVALLACFAIFPIIFSHGLEPSAGPGLVFQTLPVVFSDLPGGSVLAVLFFILLFFAALTSAVSLLEVVASYFIDERTWNRRRATLLSGTIIFLLGIPSALSGSDLLSSVTILGRNVFDTMDNLASNWMLPLGGLGMTLFLGWRLPSTVSRSEFCLGSRHSGMYRSWITCIRYVAPIGLSLVFLYQIGLLGS